MHTFNDDLSQVELRWLDRASDSLSYSGTPAAAVIHAARYPDHVTVDPSSALLAREGRWYAERRRKGDLTVVVGFPPGETPCIWGVYHNLPMPLQRLPKASTSGGGTKVPTTMRELRRRIVDAGLVIKTGGRHDRVETPAGQFVYSLSITPSDNRGIQNAVRGLARKGYDVSR